MSVCVLVSGFAVDDEEDEDEEKEESLVFWSSLAIDEVDDVVLTEAASDDIEVCVRRENGLDGILMIGSDMSGSG